MHRFLLGETHRARGERKAPEAVYLAAIALDPRLAGPYLQLTRLHAASGQFDQALARGARRSRATRRTSARFAPAANNLAWVLSEHGGDRLRTPALAQTAKEQAPEDPQISDTLGWILYRRGLHQRALALLKDSAAKLPGNPMVQYHLGMVSAQLGDQDAARQAVSEAAASPTPFPGQDEAKKALAALR